MKIRIIYVIALLLLASNLMGGGPGKFVQTWKNPEAQPINWKGKKVGAFVTTLLQQNQQGAEQALAKALIKLGIEGVPGYFLLPFNERKDLEKAKQILRDAEVAGAAIMSVVDIKEGLTVGSGQPLFVGPDAATFWGYWNYTYGPVPPMGFSPGVVDSKITVVVEASIYSVDQDRLLWKGRSPVTNPKDAADVIRKLTDKVAKEAKKEGLVSK
jgi:hypothetical protein